MPNTAEYIDLSPLAPPVDGLALTRCIDACELCATATLACADACLAETGSMSLNRCIALDWTASDLCQMTARLLTRVSAFEPSLVQDIVQACAKAVRLCAEACSFHAEHHAHCRACAEACRGCERACQGLLTALAVAAVGDGGASAVDESPA